MANFKYFKLVFKMALLCIGTLVAANTSSADRLSDITEIKTLYANWKLAVEESDIDAYLSNLHDEIRLRPPAGSPITGITNYRRFLGPVFASATYLIEVDRAPSITIFGDMAVAEYDYTIIRNTLQNALVKLDSGAITSSMSPSSYVDILRKRENGAWAVFLHTWRAQPPK